MTYDDMTLDELGARPSLLRSAPTLMEAVVAPNGENHPGTSLDDLITRRAVRDAFLDLVDEFEDQKIVLVASEFLMDLARTARERGFQEGRASVGIHGGFDRNADHG